MYKQKVRERRQKAKRAKRNIIPPDTRDSDAVQKFFLQEVQLGETLLQLGEVEAAVEHLAAAVAICEQPQQLMEILQKTLPPPVCASFFKEQLKNVFFLFLDLMCNYV